MAVVLISICRRIHGCTRARERVSAHDRVAGQSMTRAYAAITAVMGIVGALLVIALTVQSGESLLFASVLWSLAGLLAALGLYSAWAIPGGKM